MPLRGSAAALVLVRSDPEECRDGELAAPCGSLAPHIGSVASWTMPVIIPWRDNCLSAPWSEQFSDNSAENPAQIPTFVLFLQNRSP